MKKIENLTPEQEIKLVEYYDAALKAGLRIGHDEDCERIGRDAIVRAYADIGRDPPKEIL